ncbi:hypothetical protein D3C78_1587030 [compost metagenome]
MLALYQILKQITSQPGQAFMKRRERLPIMLFGFPLRGELPDNHLHRPQQLSLLNRLHQILGGLERKSLLRILKVSIARQQDALGPSGHSPDMLD